MESKRYLAGGRVFSYALSKNGGIFFSLDSDPNCEFFIEDDELRNRLFDALNIGDVQSSSYAIKIIKEAKESNSYVLVYDLIRSRHMFCIVEKVDVPFWAYLFYLTCDTTELKQKVVEICDAIEGQFSKYEGKYLVYHESEFLLLEDCDIASSDITDAVWLRIDRTCFNAVAQQFSRKTITMCSSPKMWRSIMIDVKFSLPQNVNVVKKCLIDTGASHSSLPAIYNTSTSSYTIKGDCNPLVGIITPKNVESATGNSIFPSFSANEIGQAITVQVFESSAGDMKPVTISELLLDTGSCLHGILGRDVLFQMTGMWTGSEEGKVIFDLYNRPCQETPAVQSGLVQAAKQFVGNSISNTINKGKSNISSLFEPKKGV